MKVIIAGSRKITDPKWIPIAVANSGFELSEAVSGGARGVDQMGEDWAEQNYIDVFQILANWERYGVSAGAIRNRDMAEYADALIAIHDGKSRGTQNMIDTMKKLGKPVYVELVEG